jgi:hypothetical protein
MDVYIKSGKMEDVKAAFECNRSLEELYISGSVFIRGANELNLLFQGIAAAPRLRKLHLQLCKLHVGASPTQTQQSAMFSRALIDCHNNTLEGISDLSIGPKNWNLWDRVIWNRDFNPIIDFNRERRMFLEITKTYSRVKRIQLLLEVLRTAVKANNHHYSYWLIRNHAADLCLRGTGRTQTDSERLQEKRR